MPVSVQLSEVWLCLGAWSFYSFRRVKKRRSLTEYVRAARKWRRKLCKLAAVLQGKFTTVLVETEKNAHAQSNAVSFAVTIFLSGLTGSELCLFRRRLTKLRFREFFVFTLSSFSSVFVDCYFIYGLSVSG